MTELQSAASVVATPASYGDKHRHTRPKPVWWLWANILSLEAPTVAVLWHLLLAKAFALRAGFAVSVALGCSVWVIYLFDHLFDTRGIPTSQPEPVRKIFFRNHWQLMLSVALGSLILTLTFARVLLTRTVFHAGIVGALVVCLYFGSVHLLPTRIRTLWPREAMVALLFSCGVCLPFWLAGIRFSQILLCVLPLFVLCWLNCCAVEVWDWRAAGNGIQDRPNALAKWIAEHIPFSICLILVLAIGLCFLENVYKPLIAAVVLSALSMAGVARLETKTGASRHRIPLSCVLMDVALCWPFPILATVWLSGVPSFWN